MEAQNKENVTEATTPKKEELKTVISLKLHNIMSDNGIEAEKTEINKNDPTKIVWKYKPSVKFFDLLNQYVKESHAKKEENKQ